MLRSRNLSTRALFGAALIAVSMLASPSFANIGGGNADEIPLPSNGYLGESAQARVPAPTPTARAVDKSTVCHNGYRYIQRDPFTGNGTPEEFSLPVRC